MSYNPHAWVLEFLNGEQSHENSLIEWNIYKWALPPKNIKMPRIQNHLSHILYDVILFILNIWLFV